MLTKIKKQITAIFRYGKNLKPDFWILGSQSQPAPNTKPNSQTTVANHNG